MFALSWLFKKSAFCVCAISLSFGIHCNVYAKPDLQALGPNIAEQGSSYYQFQVKNFQSADQQRHYKVWVGNFKSKIDAERHLIEIQKKYTSSIIVKPST